MRQRGRKRSVPVVLGVCLSATQLAALAALPATKKPNDYKLAETSLLQGRIQESITRLQGMIAATPSDAPSRLLLCRAFYAEDQIEDAVTACEAALAQSPNNSQIEDWLGRAYGLRADRSGPIAGFKLAKKVKMTFEASVDHDPHNGDAVDDLADYYVDAPAVIGGGTDKADALADRVAKSLPQQAHRTRALSAEKRGDDDLAEREFRAEVNVNQRPDAWIDLAAYYKRHHMVDQFIDAIQHCLAADRAHGPAIVDAAILLHEMKREPRTAEQLLQLYLNSSAKSDDAPVVKVYVLLAKLRAEAKDTSGAKIELAAALALAPNYAPAQRAMREL